MYEYEATGLPVGRQLSLIKQLDGERRPLMEFLFDTLPRSDLDMYSFDLFLEFADHALFLRQEVSWCKLLSEDEFYHYVLYPRVNDEDISSHRPLFYSLLSHRIKFNEMSVAQAIHETICFVREHSVYAPQDIRTASPLSVYRSGVGRCGELSTFSISALRSIGIAARQVYAPRWSHCDDNHAWVEAIYDDGTWGFAGSNEPEPVRNMAWFNNAASRTILVHSRRFWGSMKTDPDTGTWPRGSDPLGREGAVRWYNETRRYARVKPCVFTIRSEGKPVSGAALSLHILNYASFSWPIAQFISDREGTVKVDLGLGDVYLRAYMDDMEAEAIFHGSEDDSMVLELRKKTSPSGQWTDCNFSVPAESGINPVGLDQAQQKEREEITVECDRIRNQRFEKFFNAKSKYAGEYPEIDNLLIKARGNRETIEKFLETGDLERKKEMLLSLTEKDLRDINSDVLEDHFDWTPENNNVYPPDVFQKYVLCPRVAHEKLSPWRGKLRRAYSDEERRRFTENPRLLWDDLKSRTEVIQDGIYANVYWTPDAAFEARRCDQRSFTVLFIAFLRSFGLPARLRITDNMPQFWLKNGFAELFEEKTGLLKLKLEKSEQRPLYRRNWTLARYYPKGYAQLTLDDKKWENLNLELSLPAAFYRLITSTRLPNGEQLASMCDLEISEGKTLEQFLRLRDIQKTEDLFIHRRLPGFSALDSGGNRVLNPGIGGGDPALHIWLEENSEPCEHIINELVQSKAEINDLPLNVFLFVKEKKSIEDLTLSRVINCLSSLEIYTADWEYNRQMLGRFLAHEVGFPPLTVLTDPGGYGKYYSTGYNVGLIPLIIHMAKQLKE